MSQSAAVSERPPLEVPLSAPSEQSDLTGRALRALGSLGASTLLLAAVVCWITFRARGGLNLESMTEVETRLTIGSAIVIAAAALLTPPGRAIYGLWPAVLLAAFTALSGLSVVWSVQPDNSWQDAGRLLAYSGVFAAAVALARAAPSRWPALLGGVALATVVVCGYALLTKVYPDKLDANEIYARLQAPFGYWNATGLTAAMGVIACLWLGARRTGHAVLSALAYPAMTILLTTLMLAYSRGALAALLVGLIGWFAMVPLRLRGARVLIVGAAGAAAAVAWAFAHHALSSDNVPLSERVGAGHQFGALLAAVLVLVAIAGVAIGFFTGHRAPRPATRRRAGTALVALLVAVVIAGLGGLAASHRGLSGSVTHAVDSLTNIHATVTSNGPGRLTGLASVRAAYWNQALEIFKAHPPLGVGARGYETAQLRYREGPLEAKNAHGYIVQTLADLGVVGLVVTLALLGAWLAAAGRSTRPFDRRWRAWRLCRDPLPYTAERIGMLSMLCLVVVFGVHSFVDWTWYVPGDACVALLCAGWLAGRGPLVAPSAAEASTVVLAGGLSRPSPQRPRMPSRADLSSPRGILAVCVLVAAGLSVWAQAQPQRSVSASNEALDLLASNRLAPARAAAERAVARDPLSVQALFTLAEVQQGSGQSQLARATLQRAVRLQPSNPQTWLALGRNDLTSAPAEALHELRAAIYLNPESIAPVLIQQGNPEAITIQNDFLLALRGAGGATGEGAQAEGRPRVTSSTPSVPVTARARPRALLKTPARGVSSSPRAHR